MTITLDLSRSRDAAAAPARRQNLTGLTRPALVAALEPGRNAATGATGLMAGADTRVIWRRAGRGVARTQ